MPRESRVHFSWQEYIKLDAIKFIFVQETSFWQRQFKKLGGTLGQGEFISRGFFLLV